jgi:hypothetical protein
MPLPRLSRRTLLMILAGGVLLLVSVMWWFRWGIGMRAVRIVDPVVRRWAVNEVDRLSGGAYVLTVSPIRVDTERRRVGIDTIVVRTSPERLGQRASPLPTLQLRFHNCAVEGIDLDRLAGGRGLRATRAGCDTVTVQAAVPAPTGPADTSAAGGFLTLRENLDLGRDVPFIAIDSIAFPDVSVTLDIAGRAATRTAVAFERLSVRLDSLHYDPKQPVAERRPLFSRNIALALDGFVGSQTAANRLLLDRFRADLATGTLELDGLDWEPLPGAFADSLGLAELSLDSLRVRGIDWGAFLTAGDVRVVRIQLDGGRLRLPEPSAAGAEPATKTETPTHFRRTRRTAEGVLRAIGRRMELDSLELHDLTLIEGGGRDSILTRLGTLGLERVRIDLGDDAWSGPFPVGPLQMRAHDILRAGPSTRLAIGSFGLDLAAGTVEADSVRAGAAGTDADWLRGRRWRADRTALAVDSVRATGLEANAWMRTGAITGRRVDLHGLDLDVATDKRLPARRTAASHRTPQGWVTEVAPRFHLDTVQVTGRMQYRERSDEAPRMGVVRFERVRVTMTNLSSDPARMSDSTPLVVRADARLMGAGAFALNVRVPLLAPDFRMRYDGSLGRMPAPAMNPFIVGIAPMQFKEGRILGITFGANVTNGVARGQLRPRWDSLFVDITQNAGGGGGILGGLKRAVTKFAANEFVLKSENSDAGDDPPEDGAILHRWAPRETLLQFMWNGIRDALLPLVKR